MTRTIVALIVGSAIALLSAGIISASTPPKLTFSGVSPTRDRAQILISATLVDEAGKPLGERDVAFYQRVEFFGQRDSHIGTARTDASGIATILYEPAEIGPQTIVMWFAGDRVYAEATATGSIDVTFVESFFASEPSPLAPVSRWLPLALGGLVLATWTALLAIFVRAIVGILRPVRVTGRGGATVVSAATAPTSRR